MKTANYSSVTFQKLYMSCREHVKKKFKEVPLSKLNRQLFNAIAMLRFSPITNREELAAKTGIIEREMDRLYIQDPSTEEVHYESFIFSQCCIALAKLHEQGKLDIFKDL